MQVEGQMGGDVVGGRGQPIELQTAHLTNRYRIIQVLPVFRVLLPLLVLGGCLSGEKAESLEGRVKTFWDARVAGDDLKAYNYESHAKTGTMTATQYVRARSPALRYTSYEVKKIEEHGDTATVTIDFRYHVAAPTSANLNLGMARKEQWVRLDDGLWYRQSKKKEKEKTTG